MPRIDKAPRMRGRGRLKGHDYCAPYIYLITIMKARRVPDFGTLSGTPDVHVDLSWTGRLIEEQLASWLARNPRIRVMNKAVMPDHIHLMLRVTERLERPLGVYIGWLKTACTGQYRDALDAAGTPDPAASFFDIDFHDSVCLREGQRQHMYDYVTTNAQRRWTVLHNPEFFTRVNALRIGEKTVAAYGNRYLLDAPELAAVRISRRTDPEQYARIRDHFMYMVSNGCVLVSPWISPCELRLRDEALAAGGRIVTIVPNGFPERYKPEMRNFNLCAEGRLLIIAPTVRRLQEPKRDKRLFENLNMMAACLADYRNRRRQS